MRRTEMDPDVKANDHALRFGKAFHEILEKYSHDLVLDDDLRFGYGEQKRAEHELSEHDLARIFAMLDKYLRVHRFQGLKIEALEMEIGDEGVIGFVDAIMSEPKGWWIVDMKTAGQIATDLRARMPEDPQLNLYASYREQIAEKLGLDPEAFLGCIYRVTKKPGQREKFGEDFWDAVARCKCDCIDVIVPREQLQPDEARLNISRTAETMQAYFDDETKVPPKDLSQCFAYNRPCEYWSQCHGKVCHSKATARTRVVTSDDVPTDVAQETYDTTSVLL